MDNAKNLEQATSAKKYKGHANDHYKKMLEEKITTLKRLCDSLDPYAEIPACEKTQLIELGIRDLNNPFTITNELLLLMEDSIEELQKLTN